MTLLSNDALLELDRQVKDTVCKEICEESWPYSGNFEKIGNTLTDVIMSHIEANQIIKALTRTMDTIKQMKP